MRSADAALLRVRAGDSVAVALRDLRAGEEVACPGRDIPLVIASDVPQAHKVALGAMSVGEAVVKYGVVIGTATAAIAPGEHVHVHNIASARVGAAAP
ncbi:MAG TPA: UxaA family hydrolase [Solirubrobacteraceae bacterium]